MTYLRTTCAIAALIAVLDPATGLARDEAMRLQVYPSYAQAPAVLRIQVVVEPAAENRELRIAVDSGAYYRGSTIELEGASAARAYSIEFRAVPEGTYEVRVVLADDASRARATLFSRVVVVG
jgi:hypothetical protein